MIKILHTADLHLDSPLKSLALKDERLRERVQTASRTALERLVQFAIDEEVRALLIAGDLFDGKGRSAQTAAFLVSQLEKLQSAGISVFYIKGNHDAENPSSGAFDLPANVHVFDARGGKVQLAETEIWIHGVSFGNKHAPNSLLPKFQGPVAGAVNIGMMHTSLSGSAAHDPYAPCTVSDLQDHGFDYWALGHIHKREVHATSPWIVMPGIPQGRDIGEAGPKSATLLTIDGMEIEVSEIPSAAVEFRQSRCDVSEISDDSELRARLRAHLNSEAQALTSEDAILRLCLFGQTKRVWQIRRDFDVWSETIKEYAEETGCLWIEKIELDLTDESQAAAAGDAVAELQKLMTALLEEEGFQQAAQIEFERFRTLLPTERKQALLPDETAADKLLDEIADQGLTSILALMKGASR